MTFPQEITQALAPTGKLRASVSLDDPILAYRDMGSGLPTGLAVELARELAHDMGVGLQLIVVDSINKAAEAVTQGQADIGFFAKGQRHCQEIAFSPSLLKVACHYLVKEDSPYREMADVDRQGTRVAVIAEGVCDQWLDTLLHQAELIHVASPAKLVDQLVAGKADVAAGSLTRLLAETAGKSGYRLLPEKLIDIKLAMGISANLAPEVMTTLAQFIEHLRTSGLLQAALERHRLQGTKPVTVTTEAGDRQHQVADASAI